MHLSPVSDTNRHMSEKALALYTSTFPVIARRDDSEQARVLTCDEYHADLIIENSNFIGLMFYWETDSFVYLEHFALATESNDPQTKAVALALLKEKNKRVFVEVEADNESQSFYLENGFFAAERDHIRTKYRATDKARKARLMSYPSAPSFDTYLEFQNYLTARVGVSVKFTEEITIRPLREDDDLLQVAKLIYLTDKYIYPYWFDSIEDGQRVIREMILLPTLYNIKNVTVAVMPNGDIAGAMVTKEPPIDEREEHIVEAFRRAGVVCDERTHTIFLKYYDKMRGSERGLYLSNIAVDPKFQKRGIAASMIRYIIKDRDRCYLECVQANVGAWLLYQRLGFRIVEEYPGVFEVPCYKMVYEKEM